MLGLQRGIVGGFFMVASWAAFGQSAESTGEIIVKFKGGTPLVFARGMHASMGCQVVRENMEMATSTVKASPYEPMSTTLRRYQSMPNVVYAEPNYVVYAFNTPNDALFGSQWNMTKIHAPDAWDLCHGGPSSIIAIVDTGADLSHPDLQGKFVPGYNFIANNSNPQDDHGHGTHCSGMAAANTGNGIGVAGVCWDGKIMPVKVLSANGSGSISSVASGITWAADHGAKVISLSLGSPQSSQTLQDAINYAWSKGAVIVAAAGNDGSTNKSYPGACDHVLCVGASNDQDTRANFSNYGSWVQVAAPGTAILSCYPGGGYAYMQGTSMATPQVAGLAGLVWARLGSTATNQAVVDRIKATTDPVGTWVVKGRVNAFKAMTDPNQPPFNFNLTAASTKVFSGQTFSLTATANSNGGGKMTFPASTGLLTYPATAGIDAGKTVGTFSVGSTGVTTDTNATIACTINGVQKTISVTVMADTLRSSSLAPALVSAGGKAVLNIGLSAPLAVSNTVVKVSSSSPHATVAATTSLAKGSSTLALPVNIDSSAPSGTIKLTITMGNSSLVATLTIGAARSR